MDVKVDLNGFVASVWSISRVFMRPFGPNRVVAFVRTA